MKSALDIVGSRMPGVNTKGYLMHDIVIGAPYLITRDWTDARVVIARRKVAGSKGILTHDDNNWYATPVDPPVQVGDEVYALERAQGDTLRRERKRKVVAVNTDGVMVQYGDAAPFLATHWVLADKGSSANPEKDRFNPDRRKIVLDKLSQEGMDRIGDTGYAISAKEFFAHFDLPRPEINATAFLDVERVATAGDMDYSVRGLFDNDNVTSLRKATLSGRAKVTLPKGKCRCKEVTLEEALTAWGRSAQRWKVVKMHKVQCLWCMPDKEAKEAVENGEF